MAGYDVPDLYWRPALVKADKVGQLVSRWGSRALKGNDLGPTLGEHIAEMEQVSGVLYKVARKAGQPGFARVVDMTVDVAAGEFSGFGLPASDRDDSDQRLTERAFGYDVEATHRIHGKRLELGVDLAAILEAMSGHLPLGEFTDSEIATGRDDARNALKTAYCLYGATDWIYGRGAFGLHVGSALIKVWPLALIQALALGFARLRRRSNSLLASCEIADLAAGAERAWLMSMWLRDLHKSGGDGARIISPERLKSALTDSVSHRNLLEELANHEFAQREFRPWDQWRKSAGKTMSPGLLAMSIGAPETIVFDDLVESISAPVIP